MSFYQDRILPHLINLAMRQQRLAPYRGRVVPAAEGQVLEVGVGSGLNLPFYSPKAAAVIGLDPSPRLLAMAEAAGNRAPPSVRFVQGSAESIPLESASIDTVVTTWTLCSIPHAMEALGEMRRVLKPAGRLLFVEHGLAPDPGVRRWQDLLTPIWKRVGGGCHLNRAIDSLITNAGFRFDRCETGYMRGPKPMAFMYEGSAHPR
jgi:ubiquinone/menaquinone biosynthesis C-methylase UbiE